MYFQHFFSVGYRVYLARAEQIALLVYARITLSH